MRVLCLGDTCWKKVSTCPGFHVIDPRTRIDAEFASDTLNWLAHRILSSHETYSVSELAIFSYDLRNKAYNCLLMPYLCKNEDVLLLIGDSKLVLHNRRFNRIDHIEGFKGKYVLSHEHVHSLVLPY